MSDILPSIEHLTEEETALISDHIIPWLSYNDITLNDDGTFYSDSTIPPLVQQWLISQGARPAATPTSVAASATPTQEATDDGIVDRILPSLDDLFLPEEEKELISDHIIPWLDNNDFTLSNDGTFYSDSIIPPVVQQWLIRRWARLATAPPSVDPTATARQVAPANNPSITTGEDQPVTPSAAVAHAAPPPVEFDKDIQAAASAWLSSNIIHIDGVFHSVDPDEVVPQYVHDWIAHVRAQIRNMRQENQASQAATAATKEELNEAVQAWFNSHPATITDGVIECLDPDQTIPPYVQDRLDHNLAQIASLKAASLKVKQIQQQLPAKRKLPAANTQEHHAGATETSPTNSTLTAGETETNQLETTANSLATAMNATIEIDAQGDTVEDPINRRSHKQFRPRLGR